MITKAIKDAVYQAVKENTSRYPVYCNKKELAEILGISIQQINNYIREKVLLEGRHFSRWTPDGDPRYYVPQIVRDFAPERATITPLFDGGNYGDIMDQREKEKNLFKI